MSKKVIDTEKVRELADVWKIISSMPDDSSIGAGLAAVFLGVSEKTLGRIRGDQNSGLPYRQYPKSSTTARNQDVYYILGELRKWREGRKVHSTLEAAMMRGLAFSTLDDMLEEQPYWRRTVFGGKSVGMGREITSSYPLVIGHIQTVTDDEFSALLRDENAEVVWRSLPEVLNERWIDAESRAPFHRAYTELLHGWIEQSNAKQEAAELMSGVE